MFLIGDNKKQTTKEEDLDSLLKFIEGSKQQECKDAKKAAKRVRQKQKKLEEIERQKEEEAERKRLEAMKRQVTISLVNNKKAQKQQARQAQQQHQHQQRSAPPPPQPAPQALNLSGLKSLVEKTDPNTGPKMVTIRRVMAPFSSEPTVTITLKGSTPDKDKVLFMLKNGSEACEYLLLGYKIFLIRGGFEARLKFA